MKQKYLVHYHIVGYVNNSNSSEQMGMFHTQVSEYLDLIAVAS